MASYLLKEPARLCRSRTVAVEGIADAQMILEAEILPHVREPEGPFGEVSGYYAARADRWVVHVKAITMQKNPIIHMLHPGREVWNGQGLGIEANLFQTISKQVKGLKKVYMTHGGSHYHIVLQMDPPNNGMAKNAIMAACRQCILIEEGNVQGGGGAVAGGTQIPFLFIELIQQYMQNLVFIGLRARIIQEKYGGIPFAFQKDTGIRSRESLIEEAHDIAGGEKGLPGFHLQGYDMIVRLHVEKLIDAVSAFGAVELAVGNDGAQNGFLHGQAVFIGFGAQIFVFRQGIGEGLG